MQISNSNSRNGSKTKAQRVPRARLDVGHVPSSWPNRTQSQTKVNTQTALNYTQKRTENGQNMYVKKRSSWNKFVGQGEAKISATSHQGQSGSPVYNHARQ